MALAKDLMGLGLPAAVAVGLGGSVKTGIATAGSSITTATDLTFSKNIVSTNAAATQGVQLQMMNAGESQLVYNATTTAFLVYPGASTAAINQKSVGAAVVLPGMTVCEFHQVSATQILANLSA